MRRIDLSPRGFWFIAQAHPEFFKRDANTLKPPSYLGANREFEFYLDDGGLDELPAAVEMTLR